MKERKRYFKRLSPLLLCGLVLSIAFAVHIEYDLNQINNHLNPHLYLTLPESIGATPSSYPPPMFSQISKNILQTRCISCHSSANPSGGADYSTYEGTMKKVIPGDPSQSPLYIQVQTGRMPQGGPKLPDEQIQQIFDWIAAGALNN